MPSWVVFAVTCDADIFVSLLEFFDLDEGQLHFLFSTHDADQVLHCILERILNRKWIFTSGTIEDLFDFLSVLVDLRGINFDSSIRLGKLCGVFACEFSKHDKI